MKDSWLRLWFMGRQKSEQILDTMETGNVVTFIEKMKSVLMGMNSALRKDGRIVLVCGRAKIEVHAKTRSVRVGELCIYAVDCIKELKKSLFVERVIVDKKLMTRGSYFAVHQGKVDNGDGETTQRYGEDEIIVLRKR
jgi:hypothetical protein